MILNEMVTVEITRLNRHLPRPLAGGHCILPFLTHGRVKELAKPVLSHVYPHGGKGQKSGGPLGKRKPVEVMLKSTLNGYYHCRALMA